MCLAAELRTGVIFPLILASLRVSAGGHDARGGYGDFSSRCGANSVAM